MDTATDLIFGMEEPTLPFIQHAPTTPPEDDQEQPELTIEQRLHPMVTPSVQAWDPNLPMEVAMGLDDTETLITRHGLTVAQFEAINDHPLYKRELSGHMKNLRENGLSYKAKAKVMAEEYLLDLHSIVKSNLASIPTRLDAIKYVTKVAELEPMKGAEVVGNNQVNIQINI